MTIKSLLKLQERKGGHVMVSGDSMLTASSSPRLVLSLPVSLDARARLSCALLRIWCLPIALQKTNNKKGPYESLNECVPLHSDNSKKEQTLTFKNLSYRIIENKNRRKKCLQFKTKLLGNRKHFSFEVNKKSTKSLPVTRSSGISCQNVLNCFSQQWM